MVGLRNPALLRLVIVLFSFLLLALSLYGIDMAYEHSFSLEGRLNSPQAPSPNSLIFVEYGNSAELSAFISFDIPHNISVGINISSHIEIFHLSSRGKGDLIDNFTFGNVSGIINRQVTVSPGLYRVVAYSVVTGNLINSNATMLLPAEDTSFYVEVNTGEPNILINIIIALSTINVMTLVLSVALRRH